MCVINQKCVVAVHLNRLNSSFDFGCLKTFYNCLVGDVKKRNGTYCGKSIVNVELARNSDIYREGFKTCRFKVNSDKSALGQKMFVICFQIRVFAKAVGKHLAVKALGDCFPTFIVNICGSLAALAEQKTFAVKVFSHILVLNTADVVV